MYVRVYDDWQQAFSTIRRVVLFCTELTVQTRPQCRCLFMYTSVEEFSSRLTRTFTDRYTPTLGKKACGLMLTCKSSQAHILTS